MRQTMVLSSKRITLDVEPTVHVTGPDSLEADRRLPKYQTRIRFSTWDILATPPTLLEDSGVSSVTVEDGTASSLTSQFVDENRIIMTTPAKRLTLELDDSVRLLGPEILEVDSFGRRSKLTVWEILAYHLSGFDALFEESGVRLVGVDDDTDLA